jgi:hypothetical protein
MSDALSARNGWVDGRSRRWEDEEEFDGVAGEVLMPKTLYVCMVPAGSNAAPDICAVAAAATKQMRAALPNSATLTAGFTSDQVSCWLVVRFT